MKERYTAVSILLLIILVLAVGQIRGFGTPINTEMDTYFLGDTQEYTGASNVVTAVVFDYRGFDTLGEATVLFTAVSGTILISKYLKIGKNDVKDR